MKANYLAIFHLFVILDQTIYEKDSFDDLYMFYMLGLGGVLEY